MANDCGDTGLLGKSPGLDHKQSSLPKTSAIESSPGEMPTLKKDPSGGETTLNSENIRLSQEQGRRGSVSDGGWFRGRIGSADKLSELDADAAELEMMMEMKSQTGDERASVAGAAAPCSEQFPILASQNR